MTDPVTELAALFSSHGAGDYPGEAVTLADHMLQTAALAHQAEAPAPLIAAALLHDIGHFMGPMTGDQLMDGTDNHHSDTAAAYLAAWFPPAVTEPVRLHVAAKRYLCGTSTEYLAHLAPASRYTLAIQGGAMNLAEVADFTRLPYGTDAVQLCRWDDAATVDGLQVPAFDRCATLLRALVPYRGPTMTTAVDTICR